MLTDGPSRPALRSTAGFTLIELIVSMAISITVLMGLLSIVVVTLHQTQRTFTTIDATRQARAALATIENELHSGCVDGSSAAPIQAGSTGSNLVFLSYYGNAVSPTPTWHELTLSGGTLVDHTYQATPNPAYDGSGSTAAYLRGAAGPSTTLLTNVAQSRNSAGVIPVFEYFAYTSSGVTDSAGDTYYVLPDGTNVVPGQSSPVTAAPLATPAAGLAMSDANNTAEVMLNLLVGPSSQGINNQQLTVAKAPVTDSISLRLTTPPDYVPAGTNPTGYGPCQ